MSMFGELFALAAGANLTLTISADAKTGRMTINVVPRPHKDFDEPALTKALSLTATPQEFDAGFVEALKGYREVRQSLTDQLEATKEVLEAAKAASVKKATDANAKARSDKPSLPAKAAAAADATSARAESPADDETDAPAIETHAQARAKVPMSGEAMDLFG
jgi:PRTRC genetic system protein E